MSGASDASTAVVPETACHECIFTTRGIATPSSVHSTRPRAHREPAHCANR